MLSIILSPALLACVGPRTAGALRQYLWMNSTNGYEYDKFTRPGERIAELTDSPPEPQNIDTQLQVFRVVAMNTKAQTFTVEVYLRLMWYDRRLKYLPASEGGCFGSNVSANEASEEMHGAYRELHREGEVAFPSSVLLELWKPDAVILNLIQDDELDSVFGAVWIYSNGLVWWTRKLLVELACDFEDYNGHRGMDLRQMPYDKQRCPLRLTTFQQDSDDASFGFWEDRPVEETPGSRTSGVEGWDLLGVNGYPLDKKLVGYKGSPGGVEWVFDLSRKPQYFETGVIIPCICVVIFAWLSFFISPAAVPARASIPVIAYLVITSQKVALVATIPRTSAQVWLVHLLDISAYFVIYAACEFAFVNFITRCEAAIKEARTERNTAIEALRAKASPPSHPAPYMQIGHPASGLDVTDVEVGPTPLTPQGFDSGMGCSQRPSTAAAGFTHKPTQEEASPEALEKIEAAFRAKIGCLYDLFYRRERTRLCITDAQVDNLSRWCFPVAYAFFVILMYSSIDFHSLDNAHSSPQGQR